MTPDSYGYQQLNIEEGGPPDGAPVVLLHGWGSSAQLMRPVADALSDQYHVLNVDLPGHGASPPPPVGWGVPEYAEVVRQVIDARVGGPATIVGHSNGGRIALFMASDPALAARIGRLVLVSPSGIKPRRSWKYYLRKHTATTLKAPFEILPEPLRGFCLDWLRHSLVWRLLGSTDYRSLRGAMRETFVKTVNFYVDDRVDRIQAPTLLFWGDRDEAVSRYQMETLEARIPGAGLVVLEGAGHYGYLDDPQTFVAATRHFLAHTAAKTPAGEQPSHAAT